MHWLSPIRVITLMVVSIFSAEVSVMFLINELPLLAGPIEAIIDAGLLLILLSPTFYFFHYRPLRHHYLARQTVLEQLLQNEERLDLALTAVNDGLWDWNIESNRIFFSPRGLEILGYFSKELRPELKSWEQLAHPDDRDAVTESLHRHLTGEIESWESEHRLGTRSGHWIWVLARGRVVEKGPTNQPRRAVGTFTDISVRKLAEERLRQNEESIRQLSRQLMQTSEVEKKLLAQDLHDDFNQTLTAFQFGVEMLREHGYRDKQDYQSQCRRLLDLTAQLRENLRGICDKLRPIMLDNFGLVATLEWLIDQVSQQAPGIGIHFHADPSMKRSSSECELVMFRICQEALTNILRHANASRVEISLAQNCQELKLLIRDDGNGFLPDALRERHQDSERRWGLGLLGMHERAEAVQGSVLVDSAPGLGTSIEVSIPLNNRSFQ
jgi:two-component system, NarL family, sensor histidine kinase UhpB